MDAYQIQFSLSSDLDQTGLTQKLKSIGEVIQTSNGLCLKCSKPEQEVRKLLADSGFTNVNLCPVESEEENLSPDIQVFLNS